MMSETQRNHLVRLMPSWAGQIAAAIALNLIAAQFAMAQEHRGDHGVGHFKLHHWYKTLRQPGTGYECCDQKDCRRHDSARPRSTHRSARRRRVDTRATEHNPGSAVA